MISDSIFAKRCADLVLEYSARLDQSLADAQKLIPEPEFQAYRRAVGAVMAEGLNQVLNPIYRQHPGIKPNGLD